MSDKNATITDFARELAATRDQLAAAQARIAKLEKPLQMWEQTPGNKRNHQWWLAWEEALSAAIAAKAKEPRDEARTDGAPQARTKEGPTT